MLFGGMKLQWIHEMLPTITLNMKFIQTVYICVYKSINQLILFREQFPVKLNCCVSRFTSDQKFTLVGTNVDKNKHIEISSHESLAHKKPKMSTLNCTESETFQFETDVILLSQDSDAILIFETVSEVSRQQMNDKMDIWFELNFDFEWSYCNNDESRCKVVKPCKCKFHSWKPIKD